MRLTTAFFSKVGDITKQFSNLPESYIKRSMEQVIFEVFYTQSQQLILKYNKKKMYFCDSSQFSSFLTGSLENTPW